jgi:uncharacterized membrane protein YadS
MNRRSGTRPKRSLFLWLGTLWLLSLGLIDLWRCITLWQTRRLLAELGSTLSPAAVMLLALGWSTCGAALVAAAVGLWLRRQWARHMARAAIVVHFGLIQVYTWGFVRTGLLWERRWSTLALGLVATALVLALLTWPRPRRWLGLQQADEPPPTS